LQPGTQISTLLKAAGIAAVSLAIFAGGFALALALLPGLAGPGIDALCRWDCGWYRSLAQGGYQIAPSPDSLQANYAFYPVFPGAARLIMEATGLGFVAAALLLNMLYSVAFAWLALANREMLMLRSDRDAVMFLAAFLLSPWSLYNRVPYTEMSFNLAVLATFIAWRREQYAAAAICGLVLTATRVTGAFLPIMLLVELVLRERWRVLDLLRAPDARFRALAVMPLGGLAFFVYLGLHVGDPLASFRIQASWNQGLRDPVETLIGGIRIASLHGLISVAAFLVQTVLLIAGWRRNRVPFPLAMTGILIGGSAVLSGLISMPRHTLAFFPVYLMVPMLPRAMQWVLLAIFAAIQWVFTYHWMLGTTALI
jgi:hypothetical protein